MKQDACLPYWSLLYWLMVFASGLKFPRIQKIQLIVGLRHSVGKCLFQKLGLSSFLGCQTWCTAILSKSISYASWNCAIILHCWIFFLRCSHWYIIWHIHRCISVMSFRPVPLCWWFTFHNTIFLVQMVWQYYVARGITMYIIPWQF